jgi:hypothetical protein
VGQFSQEIIGRERRPLGREPLVCAILLSRERGGLLQFALDGVAAGEDGADVLIGYLILEFGVGNRFWSGEPILDRQYSEQQQVSDQPDRDG